MSLARVQRLSELCLGHLHCDPLTINVKAHTKPLDYAGSTRGVNNAVQRMLLCMLCCQRCHLHWPQRTRDAAVSVGWHIAMIGTLQ